MAGVFRMFSDDTVALLESAVHVVLAAAVTTGALILGGTRPVALAFAVAGLVWLLAAATVAGRRVRRMVLLRSAVPTNATIRSVRLTDSYADEWRLRRFVVVEWSTAEDVARRVRERIAVKPEELAQLTIGSVVEAEVHPTRLVGRLLWTVVQPDAGTDGRSSGG
jgi:hypothetical protein